MSDEKKVPMKMSMSIHHHRAKDEGRDLTLLNVNGFVIEVDYHSLGELRNFVELAIAARDNGSLKEATMFLELVEPEHFDKEENAGPQPAEPVLRSDEGMFSTQRGKF